MLVFNRNHAIKVFVEMYRRFNDHHATALGSEIAYFLLMSIFPFLMFLMTLLSFANLSSDLVVDYIYRYVPAKWIDLSFMENYLDYLLNERHYVVLFSSLIFTIWAASKGVNAIFRALDSAYDTVESRSYFRRRGIAYLYTVMLGVCIVAIIFFPILGEFVFSRLTQLEIENNFILWIIARFKWLIFAGILGLVLASLYYVAPKPKLTFKSILPGTIFTLASWAFMSYFYLLYVRFFTRYTTIYGSLGALILAMIWFWFLSVAIVLGGELNAVIWALKKKG
jgi:membrane protein